MIVREIVTGRQTLASMRRLLSRNSCPEKPSKIRKKPKECPDALPVVYDVSCERPNKSTCIGNVKTDLMPTGIRPKLVQCHIPRINYDVDCMGDPECPYEKKSDLKMIIKNVLIAITALVASYKVYRLFNVQDIIEVYVKEEPETYVPYKDPFVGEPEKYPKSAADLPKKVQYLIIGGGPTALGAVSAIMASDKPHKILIVSKESDPLYSKNELITSYFSEKARDPLFPVKYSGITKLEDSPPDVSVVSMAKGRPVIEIDKVAKEVTLKGGHKILYDKCLIATGSRAKPMQIKKEPSEEIAARVCLFRSLQDARRLKDIIYNRNVKDLLIYGGGKLGYELAGSMIETLKKKNIKLTLIFPKAGPLEKVLPPAISKELKDSMEKQKGVKVYNFTEVEDIKYEDCKLKVTLNQQPIDIDKDDKNDKKDKKEKKEKITLITDYIISASGSMPNVGLAEHAELEVDSNSGKIIVNSMMRINEDLFAAGECATYFNLETNSLESTCNEEDAFKAGYIAGKNMSGEEMMYTSELDIEMPKARTPIQETQKTISTRTETTAEESESYESTTTTTTTTTTTGGLKFDMVGDISTELPAYVAYKKKTGTDNLREGALVYYNKGDKIVGVVRIGAVSVPQTKVEEMLKENNSLSNLDDMTSKLFASE